MSASRYSQEATDRMIGWVLDTPEVKAYIEQKSAEFEHQVMNVGFTDPAMSLWSLSKKPRKHG